MLQLSSILHENQNSQFLGNPKIHVLVLHDFIWTISLTENWNVIFCQKIKSYVFVIKSSPGGPVISNITMSLNNFIVGSFHFTANHPVAYSTTLWISSFLQKLKSMFWQETRVKSFDRNVEANFCAKNIVDLNLKSVKTLNKFRAA